MDKPTKTDNLPIESLTDSFTLAKTTLFKGWFDSATILKQIQVRCKEDNLSFKKEAKKSGWQPAYCYKLMQGLDFYLSHKVECPELKQLPFEQIYKKIPKKDTKSLQSETVTPTKLENEPIDIPAKVVEESPKEEMSTYVTKKYADEIIAMNKALKSESKQVKADNRDLRMEVASEQKAHNHTINTQSDSKPTNSTQDDAKAYKALEVMYQLIESLEVNPRKCPECHNMLKKLNAQF